MVSGGEFISTKIIRQGDPLSPYLFVLVMEVFSQLLLSRYEAGNISFHPKASEQKISHFMFADHICFIKMFKAENNFVSQLNLL